MSTVEIVSIPLALAVIVFIFGYSLQIRAERRRRNRFKDRSLLSEEEWLSTFHHGALTEETALIVLRALGESFGVDHVRLRPSDNIRTDLRLDGVLSLDDAAGMLEYLLKREFRNELHWDASWETVDDVIRGIGVQAERPLLHEP
jgi:hypothetical protein